MSKVDENLLGKLVIKYGLDREQNPKDRNRLWFKLTKEYNDITGGSHPKSKLSKKWQNVAFRDKSKAQLRAIELTLDSPLLSSESSGKIKNEPFSSILKNYTVVSQSPNKGTQPGVPKGRLSQASGPENIWSVCDFALRDLFLHLVLKHDVESIRHPHVRSQLWSDLATEFNSLHRIQGLYIKQDKLSKKWQNWKSYNKLKGLPHPTEVVGNLDDDVIKVKLRRLRERVCSDSDFAANVAAASDLADIPDVIRLQNPHLYTPLTGQEHERRSGGLAEATMGLTASIDDEEIARLTEDIVQIQTEEDQYCAMMGGSGGTVGAVLDRRIGLRRLRAETDRHRLVLETGQLEQKKLGMEIDLVQTQLEQAKVDLEMKKLELAKAKQHKVDNGNLESQRPEKKIDM